MTPVDAARRLELTDPVERGDRVSGGYGELTVDLWDAPPFTAVTIDLERHLPIEKLSARGGNVVSPELALSGDEAFDDVVTPLALAGRADALRALLQSEPLRRLFLEILSRHPNAEVRGDRVVIPASEGGIDAPTIKDAVDLGRALMKTAF